MTAHLIFSVLYQEVKDEDHEFGDLIKEAGEFAYRTEL